jgi:hypothetical protein
MTETAETPSTTAPSPGRGATVATSTTGTSTPAGRAAGDDRGLGGDIRELVENAVGAVGRAGVTSAAGVADAVEGAGRSIARRMVSAALTQPRHVPDRKKLAAALAEKPSTPFLASGTAAALAGRFMRHVGPLKFVSRRTPAFLLASAVPALVASVQRGADELGLVAAHLAARAREEGVEPDAERLRRVAVQVASGVPVDADVEPRHGPLAVKWLRRAARAILPFSSGVATADPEGLARAAVAVDVRTLGTR